MYKNLKPTVLSNFSSGLVTKVRELNGMQSNASPECMNVYADVDGALHKRKGATRLNSAVVGSGDRCNGLYDFEGTLIGGFGDAYYFMNELDGTWHILQDEMKDAIIQFEDYQGNLIICNWGDEFAKTLPVSGSTLPKYTKLLLHLEGTDGDHDIIDATGRAVTNGGTYVVPAFDTYTKLICHFDGANASQPTPAITGQDITYYGSCGVSTTTPKFGTASLLLNGTSQYASLENHADWQFESGAFSIDYWCKVTTVPPATDVTLASYGRYGTTQWSWNILVAPAGITALQYSTDGTTMTTLGFATTYVAGTWTHIELTRSGDLLYCFQDGVQVGSAQAITGSLFKPEPVNRKLFLGVMFNSAGTATKYWKGNIDEFRVSKGVARHTANFSVETAEYSKSALVDERVELDTGLYKIGSTSGYWQGTSAYLSLSNSTDWNFGDDNFTFDFWAAWDGLPAGTNDCALIGRWSTTSSTNLGWLLWFNDAGTDQLTFSYSTDGITPIVATFNWTPPVTATFYHIAIIRNGADLVCTVDGTQVGATYNIGTDKIYNSTRELQIGAIDGALFFKGWFDEVRVSKDIARWTTYPFTPQTTEYSLFDASENTMIDLNTSHAAGKGKHPKIYKDHLLMSGVPDYPYTFWYSAVNDYTNFDDGGNWPIVTHDGDILTGWGELQNRLYAFKRWSIHQMTYRGGSPYWARTQITWGIGTAAPLTIKNATLSDGKEVLMFLGADRRIYQFDGYNCSPVSTNIEENNGISPISMLTLNQYGLEYAHAVVDTQKHWYILFVANGGSTDITHAIVYNYFTGACWPFDTQNYRASCTALDSVGRRWRIVGGRDGYAYRWQYGNTDSGTTITSYHTTPRLLVGKDSTIEIPQVVLSMAAVSDDNILFNHREEYRAPWLPTGGQAIKLGNTDGEYYLGVDTELGDFTLGPKMIVKEYMYGLDVQGQYIQFKISDTLVTEPWSLYAYSFIGWHLASVPQEA